MQDSRPTDRRTHETAACLAVRCRRIIQACLREEEWGEADREFYLVIREALETHRAGGADRLPVAE